MGNRGRGRSPPLAWIVRIRPRYPSPFADQAELVVKKMCGGGHCYRLAVGLSHRDKICCQEEASKKSQSLYRQTWMHLDFRVVSPRVLDSVPVTGAVAAGLS